MYKTRTPKKTAPTTKTKPGHIKKKPQHTLAQRKFRGKANPGNLKNFLAEVSNKNINNPFSDLTMKRNNTHLEDGNRTNNRRDGNNDRRGGGGAGGRGGRDQRFGDNRGDNNNNDGGYKRQRNNDGSAFTTNAPRFNGHRVDFNRTAFLEKVQYSIPPVMDIKKVMPQSAKLFANAASPITNPLLKEYTNPDNTLHDPVLDIQLCEHVAGLNQFVSPHQPIHSLVKKHYDDFIVQEITTTDQITTVHPLKDAHQLPPEDIKTILYAKERIEGREMLTNVEMLKQAQDELTTIFGESHADATMQWFKNAAQFVKNKTAVLPLHTTIWQFVQHNKRINNKQPAWASAFATDGTPGQTHQEFLLSEPITLPFPVTDELRATGLVPDDAVLSDVVPDYLLNTGSNASRQRALTQQYVDITITPEQYIKWREARDAVYPPFVIKAEVDKAARTQFHAWVKKYFELYLVSDTQAIDGVIYPRLVLTTQNTKKIEGHRLDCRSARDSQWPAGERKYLHFTLEKRDMDSLNAQTTLVNALHKVPQTIGAAGIKDRRGITTQRISLEYTTSLQVLKVIYGNQYVDQLTNKILKLDALMGVEDETSEEQTEDNDNDNNDNDNNGDDNQKTTENKDEDAEAQQEGQEQQKPKNRKESRDKAILKANLDGPLPTALDKFNERFDVTKLVNMAEGRDVALWPFHVGQFSYESEPLTPGSLKGNRFTIACRDITPLDDYQKVQQAAAINKVDPTKPAYSGNNRPVRTAHTDHSIDQPTYDELGKVINYANPTKDLQHIVNTHNHYVYTPEVLQHTAQDLLKTITSLGQKGFINYFGEQRFGRFWNSHILGYLYFTGRWQKLVQVLLAPKAGERVDIRNAKQFLVGKHVNFPGESLQIHERNYTSEYPQGGWDLERAVDAFNSMNMPSVERKLVMTILNADPRDLKRVVGQGIPHQLQSLYQHAYQSYMWNNAASARFNPDFMQKSMEELQEPIVGDLVMIKPVAAKNLRDALREEEAKFQALKRQKLNEILNAKNNKQQQQQQQNAKDDVIIQEQQQNGGGDEEGNVIEEVAVAVDEDEDNTTVVDVEVDDGDESKAASFQSEVHIVTQDDVKTKRFTINDVVLPMVGTWVYYPTHQVGDLLRQATGADGILIDGKRFNPDGTPNNNNIHFFQRPTDADVDVTKIITHGTQQGFAQAGSYRTVVKKPSTLDFTLTFSAGKIDQTAMEKIAEEKAAAKKAAAATTADTTTTTTTTTMNDADAVVISTEDKTAVIQAFDFNEFQFVNKRNYYMSFDQQTSQYTLNITEQTSSSDETAREVIQQYHSSTPQALVEHAMKDYQKYFEANNKTTNDAAATAAQTDFKTNMILRTSFALDPSTYATVLTRELFSQSPYSFVYRDGAGVDRKQHRPPHHNGNNRDRRDNNRGGDRRDNNRGGRDNNRGGDRRDNNRGGRDNHRGGDRRDNNRGGDRRDNNRGGRDNNRR